MLSSVTRRLPGVRSASGVMRSSGAPVDASIFVMVPVPVRSQIAPAAATRSPPEPALSEGYVAATLRSFRSRVRPLAVSTQDTAHDEQEGGAG